MQSPPPHAHDEFVDDVRVSTIDPALVLCRGGKIVWATSSLAELLQLPSTPTVMGYDLLQLFNNAGRVLAAHLQVRVLGMLVAGVPRVGLHVRV